MKYALLFTFAAVQIITATLSAQPLLPQQTQRERLALLPLRLALRQALPPPLQAWAHTVPPEMRSGSRRSVAGGLPGSQAQR